MVDGPVLNHVEGIFFFLELEIKKKKAYRLIASCFNLEIVFCIIVPNHIAVLWITNLVIGYNSFQPRGLVSNKLWSSPRVQRAAYDLLMLNSSPSLTQLDYY